MKLIKKIAAIMLFVMMILGMASVVSAAGTTETGTITINDAINGQKYIIYKLLDLESYDKDKNLYSYKPAAEWKTFFETNEQGKEYVDINANGYVTWKEGADAATLAQKALAYAKDGTNSINTKTEVTASGTTATFSGLELGYYLVDSSLGALCSLNTTNPTVIIKEKNGVPSVEKGVSNGKNYVAFNYANIGDVINFQTIIDVKKGAYNYKLIDEMEPGFELKDPMNDTILTALQVYASDGLFMDKLVENTDYTLTKNTNGFTVEFSNDYLKKHETVEYKIVVTYAAILTGDAKIGKAEGNKNTAYLTYGDKNTKSAESVTNTYTFGIPVFKYTGTNTPLAGAKFSLYSDKACSTKIDLLKGDTTKETYRKFIAGKDTDDKKVTEITTNDSGKFNITGLNSGTYYLKEIEAPKGYNKLKDPVTVVIAEDGTITVNGSGLASFNSSDATVKVQNNTGTILPTTGGNGTSLIYFLGAVLALVSGVVLITKQRMKNS